MPTLNKQKAIRSYQKQHGLHHKIDKKYGKVYWPYLPMLLITILGISVGIFVLFQNQNTKPSSVNYASLFNSTNQYRIKNGLDQLIYSKDLSTAAQSQANQIAIADSWSPLNESKYPAFSLITTKFQNLSSPSENLAYGFKTSGSIISAWSNSDYQNSNILNQHSNSVGYGIVNSINLMDMKNQAIVIAIFANNRTIPMATKLKAVIKPYGVNTSTQTLAIIRLNSIIKYSDVRELYILGTLMFIIGVVILSKHTYLLHKWIVSGENLVIKHPVIDLTLIVSFIILAGAIQTTGYIS
jgi:uncharacterized protein YkwD